MGYSRILVPLDGTPFAELALQHIPRVADLGAHIHLLSVVIDMAFMAEALTPQLWPLAITDEIQARKAYLAEISASLTKQGYHVTTEVEAGQPVSLIASGSNSFDLIVMATHGRTGLTRFLIGSVSEGVIREAQCPVLIV